MSKPKKLTNREIGCNLGWHNPRRGLVLVPIFGGHMIYPACKSCIKEHEDENRGLVNFETLVERLEKEVRQYMAAEPAFQHESTKEAACSTQQ
jgi:hypothetical protein